MFFRLLFLASLFATLFLFVTPSFAEQVTMKDMVINKADGLFYKKFTPNPFSGVIAGTKKSPSSGELINGKKEGQWHYYKNDGYIEQMGFYENGLKDGPWLTYQEDGIIEESITFKKGKVDGPWITYHKNGKIAGMGFVITVNGEILEHGLFEFRDEDGILKETNKWNLGKIIDDGDE